MIQILDGVPVVGMLIGNPPPDSTLWDRVRWYWRNWRCMRGHHSWSDYFEGEWVRQKVRMCFHCCGHQCRESREVERS